MKQKAKISDTEELQRLLKRSLELEKELEEVYRILRELWKREAKDD